MPRLVDEIPTKQEATLQHLHAEGFDVWSEAEQTAEDEEVAWGSDPFDILAHKEEVENHD